MTDLGIMRECLDLNVTGLIKKLAIFPSLDLVKNVAKFLHDQSC